MDIILYSNFLEKNVHYYTAMLLSRDKWALFYNKVVE